MTGIDVIALGGNAILPVGQTGTIGEQLDITTTAMEQVVDLVEQGRRIVLTHGNGPIVGNIVIRNEAAADIVSPMPLDICGADSQGGIGYMIQQCLRNVFRRRGVEREVGTVVTQVVVNAKDPAFEQPTKPIGPFYNEEEAKRLSRERGWSVVEDSGRGWRRAVPSPRPVEIVERRVIENLIESGVVVITCGGGGVPVVVDGSEYRGCEAVVDKDTASSLLARDIRAERFIILTDIDAVYRDYGTDRATALRHVSLADIGRLAAEGQFAKGSMRPKVEAAAEFVRTGGKAIICASSELSDAADGRAGTTILRELKDGTTPSVRGRRKDPSRSS